MGKKLHLCFALSEEKDDMKVEKECFKKRNMLKLKRKRNLLNLSLQVIAQALLHLAYFLVCKKFVNWMFYKQLKL